MVLFQPCWCWGDREPGAPRPGTEGLLAGGQRSFAGSSSSRLMERTLDATLAGVAAAGWM